MTIGQDVILLELKIGGGEEFLKGLLARKIAVALAIKSGIALTDAELDDAVAEFYGDRDIFEDAQIAAWLLSMRLDEASIREYVHETALVARAQNVLITDDGIRDRFASDRYDYTTAEVEGLPVCDRWRGQGVHPRGARERSGSHRR